MTASQPNATAPVSASLPPDKPTRPEVLARLADALNERVIDEYDNLFNRVAARVARVLVDELGQHNAIELFGEVGSRRFSAVARDLLDTIASACLSEGMWSHPGDPSPRVLDVLYASEAERLVKPPRSTAQPQSPADEEARMRLLSKRIAEAFKGLPGVQVFELSNECPCPRCATAPKGAKVDVAG